jgi:hypothetical protein
MLVGIWKKSEVVIKMEVVISEIVFGNGPWTNHMKKDSQKSPIYQFRLLVPAIWLIPLVENKPPDLSLIMSMRLQRNSTRRI